MRYINKRRQEPPALVDFKKRMNEGDVEYKNTYKTLYDDNGVFNHIQRAIASEQGFICAYCMDELEEVVEQNGDRLIKMRVEHFKPRSIFNGQINNENQANKLCDKLQIRREDLRIEYSNLLGVCNGSSGGEESHCDRAPQGKGDTELCFIPNPAQRNNQNSLRLRYTSNWTIVSDIPEIDTELNDVLNLNEENLRKRRQSAWRAVTKQIVRRTGLNNWEEGGDDFLEEVRKIRIKYGQKKRDGKFHPFCDCITYRLGKRFRGKL